MFLLSGLFCCLGVSGVDFILLFGRVRVYFLLFGRGPTLPELRVSRLGFRALEECLDLGFKTSDLAIAHSVTCKTTRYRC